MKTLTRGPALRVTVRCDQTLLESAVIDAGTLTVGSHPGNRVVLPFAGIPKSARMVERRRGRLLLHCRPPLTGELELDGHTLDVAALAVCRAEVELPSGARARLKLGRVELELEEAPAPSRPERVKLPPEARGAWWRSMDRLLVGVTALTLTLNFGFTRALAARAPVASEPTLEDPLLDRFVHRLLPPVQPPPAAPAPPAPQVASAPAPSPAGPRSVSGKPTRKGYGGLIVAIDRVGPGGMDAVFGGVRVAGEIEEALRDASNGAAASLELGSNERQGSTVGTVAELGLEPSTQGGAGQESRRLVERRHQTPVVVKPPDEPPVALGCEANSGLIGQVVKRHLRSLQVCYENEIKRIPGLQGKVVARFVIGFEGTVEDVEIEQTTIRSQRMLDCVRRSLGYMTFPTPLVR